MVRERLASHGGALPTLWALPTNVLAGAAAGTLPLKAAPQSKVAQQ